MFYRRSSHHLLATSPSARRCELAEHYFPGINLPLLAEWWRYVDEGGSISPEDVALAVQYAVVYGFLKNLHELKTAEVAKEFIAYGLEVESEGICGEKGVDPSDISQIWEIATARVMAEFENGYLGRSSSISPASDATAPETYGRGRWY